MSILSHRDEFLDLYEISNKSNEVNKMNNDLISRSALKKAIDEAYGKYDGYDPHDLMRFAERVDEEIDNAPTVSFMISPDYVTELQNLNKSLVKQLEEAERPQGEWINKRTFRHDGEFYCSKCEFELESFVQGAFYNFCPNCGADMREEADNE